MGSREIKWVTTLVQKEGLPDFTVYRLSALG